MALAITAGPSLAWGGDSNKHRLVNKQRVERLKEQVADLRKRLKHHKRHRLNVRGSAGSLEALQEKFASLENSMPTLLSVDSVLLGSLRTA